MLERKEVVKMPMPALEWSHYFKIQIQNIIFIVAYGKGGVNLNSYIIFLMELIPQNLNSVYHEINENWSLSNVGGKKRLPLQEQLSDGVKTS